MQCKILLKAGHASAAALLLFVLVRNAKASTVTIVSNADTTLFSNNVNNSAGGAIVMFSGTDANSSVKRALVEFDIAGNIPAGSIISGAQLTLFLGQVAGNATTGTATLGLHRLTAAWGGGTTGTGATIAADGQGFAAGTGDATWQDRFFSPSSPAPWTNAGGDFVSSTSSSTTVAATLNTGYTWLSTPTMVADVQGWLSNPATDFGWLLQNSDELSAKTFRAFYTREESSSVLQPQLQITYTAVPEPGVFSLVGVAALGLLCRRR